MEKLTLHRALSELKLIDAKITRAINEVVPCGVYQKGKLINNTKTEEEFKQLIQSKYVSVKDLIERKIKIKSAIVRANATAKVKIGDNELTIADAINLKATMELKKGFAKTLRDRLNHNLGQFNKANESVKENLQRILEATFGKENVKVSKDDIDNVSKPYLEANEFHIFDPLKVEEKLETMQKEIDEFEAEVDATLSEANAITFIEL